MIDTFFALYYCLCVSISLILLLLVCANAKSMVFKQFSLGMVLENLGLADRVSFSRKLINWLKILV